MNFTRNTKLPCIVLFDRGAASVGFMNGSSGVARAIAAGRDSIGRSAKPMTRTRRSDRSTANSGHTQRAETIEVVEENREHLQSLSGTDLPAAWIAEAILDEAASSEQGGAGK